MTGRYTHPPRPDLDGFAPAAHGHMVAEVSGLSATLGAKAPLAGPTFTGTVSIPAGSVAAPALAFEGDPDTGVSRPAADRVALSAGGAARLTASTTGVAVTGALTSAGDGAASHVFTAAGGVVDVRLDRYGGTLAAPAATQANDLLGRFLFGGHTGTGPTFNRAGLWCRAVEAFTTTANGTQVEMWTTPPGSTTTTLRLTVEAGGGVDLASGPLKVAGSEVVTAARHIRPRSYTVATLPSAATAGQLVVVSDGASDKRLAVSDGAAWRWPDGAVVS